MTEMVKAVINGEFEIMPEEINEVIDQCALKEATRVTRILKLKSISKDYKAQTEAQRQARNVLTGKGKAPVDVAGNFMAQINNLTDNDKIIQIRDFCVNAGRSDVTYTTVKTRKGDILRLFEGEFEVDDINDLITRCSSGMSFGKKKASKVRSNFKLAAKKCKGKPNYRKCMGRTLRKMYSFGKKLTPRNKNKKEIYRVGLKRKSPSLSATSVNIGTVRKGNDGNIWRVIKASNGVKRWVKA